MKTTKKSCRNCGQEKCTNTCKLWKPKKRRDAKVHSTRWLGVTVGHQMEGDQYIKEYNSRRVTKYALTKSEAKRLTTQEAIALSMAGHASYVIPITDSPEDPFDVNYEKVRKWARKLLREISK